MSYKKLEIWSLSREVVIEIHKMTLQNLHAFELYEERSQIRRSVKSVKSNIVEACLPREGLQGRRQGYGRRRYVGDYLRFLTYSQASNDETIDHLETLYETGSLKDQEQFDQLHSKLELLGKKLNLFIQSIERSY